MLLPYDPALGYWMMAVPLYVWQADPPVADALSAQDDPPGALPVAPSEAPHPTSGTAAFANAEDDEARAQAGLPQLRLVQVGIRWVAIPYWSPRDNPFWNLVADAARDDDRHRLEAKRNEDRQRALPGGEAHDPVAGRQPE
jgi:hypothetical protein